MKTIDGISADPNYNQLKELLIEKIIAGEWKPGERIPAIETDSKKHPNSISHIQ